MSKEPRLFSPGSDHVLDALSIFNKDVACFPAFWDASERHVSARERLAEWFARCVSLTQDGTVGSCEIEPGLALFAFVKRSKERITYASFQAVRHKNLVRVHQRKRGQLAYLRFDYEPERPGPLFCEPVPHVHGVPDGPPRHFIPTFGSNVVTGILHHVYRNYYPSIWLSWAERVWNRWWASARRTEENPFPTIRDAFTAGQIGYLRERQQHVSRLREVLTAELSTAYHPCGDPTETGLLSFYGFPGAVGATSDTTRPRRDKPKRR
ncbi:MAG TPA: hypothetical protein VHO06_15780 [Polyangia bacterium]|nr:hypothetical protein [Polyangia bacterium]